MAVVWLLGGIDRQSSSASFGWIFLSGQKWRWVDDDNDGAVANHKVSQIIPTPKMNYLVLAAKSLHYSRIIARQIDSECKTFGGWNCWYNDNFSINSVKRRLIELAQSMMVLKKRSNWRILKVNAKYLSDKTEMAFVILMIVEEFSYFTQSLNP